MNWKPWLVKEINGQLTTTRLDIEPKFNQEPLVYYKNFEKNPWLNWKLFDLVYKTALLQLVLLNLVV